MGDVRVVGCTPEVMHDCSECKIVNRFSTRPMMGIRGEQH